MYDLEALAILLIVNVYLLLSMVVFGLSVNDIACVFRRGKHCAKQQRKFKSIVAIPLVLSCLAVLGGGLFAIGLSHGSRPEGYQVVLFILGCFLPVVLLVVWAVGSLLVDALWLGLVSALFVYLMVFNPAIYVQYWADSKVQWAQLWMAQNYASGQGGLTQSKSTARRWFKLAALSGSSDAQYEIASTARHGREAARYYLLAAEQGHGDAMVQMARLGPGSAERQKWLNRAVDEGHPEAIFMLAKQTTITNLPEARRLLVNASERGSRSAIVYLIAEYQQGGVLFERDDTAARHWLQVLQKTPVSRVEPSHLTPVFIEKIESYAAEDNIQMGNTQSLFRQARLFLAHPAKDQILHDRAIDYLSRAAGQGHGESAFELARLFDRADGVGELNVEALNVEALKWYQLAANLDSLPALRKLATHFKEQKNVRAEGLQQSLEYNERLLELLQTAGDSKQRFALQHWASEYRDTEKRLARLKRLGGSWAEAIEQAGESPQKEFLLAKEMLGSRQFEKGMQHMKSAARRGNSEARFELALRTLRGPRSFSQEVTAVSDLQALDRLDFLPASLRLGSLCLSGTGLVPRNYYLARQLFRKAQIDVGLSEKAERWLGRIPEIIDGLNLRDDRGFDVQIEAWFQEARTQVQDGTLLRQQYEVLMDHYKDIEGEKNQLEPGDGRGQYQLAQTMQSHDLALAMDYLKRAATNGDSDAQYELAVRMVRGKKNTKEQQRDLVKWANTAADNDHVGALVFLANQHKSGNGGFERDISLAKDYYQRALQSSKGDVLFRGKIAGRIVEISRSRIRKSLSALVE